MRFLIQILITGSAFFNLAAEAASAPDTALEISRAGRQLRQKIERFYRSETFLYANPMFGSIQNWTLENQRYNYTQGQIFHQIAYAQFLSYRLYNTLSVTNWFDHTTVKSNVKTSDPT